ncbi:unnamed protein product [Didymodactylos carnosus]|uniref:NAD(P)(+)--arginine ADP-ribosyltransferase n=1 Tax=Didymodactylos carnosus TaxID=1234261 RepID=A0A8S2DZX2_9BILA|nr:unnamed protein product [Didymodactylos carnosus]CAF3781481.1 unnamed protein product [Didymodactylos carnosus]
MCFPCVSQIKKQMIDACRQYYHHNMKELKSIEQFEQEYRPEHAIHWYIKKSFLDKIINKALRNRDMNQLHLLLFFIKDLPESLAHEHKRFFLSGEKSFSVYRGVKLSSDQLDELRENLGKLVSMNGFLLASSLRSVALAMATKSTKRGDSIPVLLEIKCSTKDFDDRVVFADIAEFSAFADDQEVLFDLNTTYRLENIAHDEQAWLIEMTTCNDGQAAVEDYISELCYGMEDLTITILFGKHLCKMGQFDEAKKYFELMLSGENGEDRAWID